MPHSSEDTRKNLDRLTEEHARAEDNTRDGTRLEIRRIIDGGVSSNPNKPRKKKK